MKPELQKLGRITGGNEKMKLTELDPHWTVQVALFEIRRGMGVSFFCPVCRTHRVAVWFQNPIDGGAPAVGMLWQRQGDTFDTMTLSPSMDMGALCWHGFVRNGEIV